MTSGFRTRIVKQWTMKQPGSPAEIASRLTELAKKLGLAHRHRSLPGAALAEWSRDNDTPLWAALTAFSAELTAGWRPDNQADWAGFAALYLKKNKSTELDVLLSGLPDDFDKPVAAGWLAAAIEEDLHYRTRKKLAQRDR